MRQKTALAVLSRVAPFCADRCLFPASLDFHVAGAPWKSRLVENPTTNSAIQNKPHIESIQNFLDMSNPTPRRNVMAWNTPRIVEIAVGMEISTYSCADL